MPELTRAQVIENLSKQFSELHDAAYDKDANLARQRGLDFEKLLHSLFDVWGMLVRGSYHTEVTRSEQIDGFITFSHRLALMEAKWQESNLVASDLFSFLGKVEGKFSGTIGVFVSRKPLATNFLSALRSGRRQCIIVLHGTDLDMMFNPAFDLPDYLHAHLLHISMDNSEHLSADRYLERKKSMKAVQSASDNETTDVDKFIKKCLEHEGAKNITYEFVGKMQSAQCVEAVNQILNLYPGVELQWQKTNFDSFLVELVPAMPAEATSADLEYFVEKLSMDFEDPDYNGMIALFAPRFKLLAPKVKNQFEVRLLKQWEDAFDDWKRENSMSLTTRSLWADLSQPTQSVLISFFVKIVISIRRPNNPQYQLANYVLEQKQNKITAANALMELARNAASVWFEEGTDAKRIDQAKSSVAESMKHMRRYLPDFDVIINEAVKRAAHAK